MRYVVYPLVAPLFFGAAFSMYHWRKLTLELLGWNFASAYVLFLLPSLIVAAVDSRGLRRGSDTRLGACIGTMLLTTALPFVLILPQARFEPYFLLVLVIAALVATVVCFLISDVVQPNPPAPTASE